MMGPWRRLALVAATNLAVGAGAANAQTLLLRKAPAGSTVEVVFNLTPAGSATVGAGGEASLKLEPSARGGKTETDARVFVDVCAAVRRVILVERGLQPAPPDTACRRTEVGQYVLLRPATTLVIDVSRAEPTVWVSQGPPPKQWLQDVQEEVENEERPRRPSPTGLVLSGGAGLASLSTTTSVSCGNVSECQGDSSGLAYSVGATFWLTRFFGAELAYLKPADATASFEGTDTNYRFDSTLDTRILVAAGKLAIPIGPVRIYGTAGANLHRALFTISQTIDDMTIVVDGVEQTIPGGTQVIDTETQGWGWLFGGGIEGWVSPSFALFAEAGFAKIKGGARGGASGELDDKITSAIGGIRVRIGR